MPTLPIIELDGVTKTYGRGHTAVTALADISFTIPQSGFWAIMGPSGSGKSTLLHLLGLLDRPSHGSIRIDQITVTPKTNLSELARLRRSTIGFVFQQFFLLPRVSALENVLLPALYAGQSLAAAQQRARELLKDVGLTERVDHFPNQLSGGEQQRVAIARALMNNPAVILADEPTGNLDSANGKKILELLEKLHQEQEKTIILVTHEEQIGKRAERIIRLKDGKVEK